VARIFKRASARVYACYYCRSQGVTVV
jgi:hypothetical protein